MSKPLLSPCLHSASRHYRPDLQCIRRDEISERQFVVTNNQEVDLMADIIEKGDKEDVQLFIDLYGFFPVDSDGRIPLHYASAYGNLGLVKDLLDRYYEEEVNRMVRMRDCDGKTALFAAAQCGHLEVVEELVLHGADVNCYIYESDGTRTYPHQCAAVYDHWDVVDFLLKNGVKSHDTSLHLATAMGNINMVRFFLSRYPKDVQVKNMNGETPLHLAAYEGDLELVRYLTGNEAGVDLNVTNSVGETPLDLAAHNSHLGVAVYLMGKGATLSNQNRLLSMQDYDGKTALFHAVEQGLLEVIEELVRYGADVNCYVYPSTPLHIAVERGK